MVNIFRGIREFVHKRVQRNVETAMMSGKPRRVENIVPFSVARTAALSLGKKGYQAIKVAIKAHQKKTAAEKLVEVGAIAGGAGLIQYAATGKVPIPSLRTAAGIAGYSLGGFPSLFLGGFGTGKSLISEGILKLKEIKPPEIPEIISSPPPPPSFDINTFKDTFKDIFKDMPSPTNIFNISSPTPTMGAPLSIMTPPSQGASFAPSLSVSGGGGIGENLPLMLLLLGSGAGALGYIAGRRKRKKKRYKKRRRR